MMLITGQTTAGVTIRGTKLACGAAKLVREPAADLASGNVERIGRVAGKLAE